MLKKYVPAVIISTVISSLLAISSHSDGVNYNYRFIGETPIAGTSDIPVENYSFRFVPYTEVDTNWGASVIHGGKLMIKGAQFVKKQPGYDKSDIILTFGMKELDRTAGSCEFYKQCSFEGLNVAARMDETIYFKDKIIKMPPVNVLINLSATFHFGASDKIAPIENGGDLGVQFASNEYRYGTSVSFDRNQDYFMWRAQLQPTSSPSPSR